MRRSHYHTLALFLSLLFISGSLGPRRNSVWAQSRDTVVAIVNEKNITQAEVDSSVISELFALEQQIYALRRAALDHLISRRLLENEAARRNISVEELRRRLT